MSVSARVLFIGEAITLSHVARPVALARALDPARYDVTLACDPRYDFLVADRPFRVAPLVSSVPRENLADALTSGRPLFDADTLDRYVQEDLALIRETAPDLVVGDMRQSLAVSASLARVPYLNVINAQWSPYSGAPFELPDNPLAPILGQPIAGLMLKAASSVGFSLHTLPINAVRLKYGLAPLPLDIRAVFSFGDYVAYPDLPKIVPTPGAPRNHRHIGPILWSPEVATPEWWDAVPSDKPVIYVSLGSSGRQPLLGPIVEALSRLPVTVMAATAGAELDVPVPANAFVADYLPGLEAARRARLVVCNGGNLSTQQALAAGAPVLMIVTNFDQALFARAVAESGLGEMLREREVAPSSIRRAAWRLLQQGRFRDAARRVADICAHQDAGANFGRFVDEIVGAREAASGARG